MRKTKTYFCVIIKPLFSSKHLKEFFKTAFKTHLLDNLQSNAYMNCYEERLKTSFSNVYHINF